MERSALILARKVGQRVVIGDGDDRIVVEVMKPRGQAVRLRIEAPYEVPIDREELLEEEAGDAVA